ncbi:MAG TPA: hypothetical protein VHM90_07775 [Phycisphaerae bacterium]|nr:hypothetical protein [Phycisphaerae bacterium]
MRAAEPAYAIKLDRPLKAGEIYEERFTVDSQTRTVTTEPGGAPRTKEVSIKGDAVGRVEILEVNAGGNPVAMSMLVRKFVAGPEGKEAVPGGKVVEIRRTDKDVQVSLKNGGEMSEEAKQVIASCFGPLNRDKGMSDDLLQGTPIRRRVGDTWKTRHDGKVPDGIEMDPRDFTSRMLFKSVETANDVPALRLVWTIQMKDFKSQLPPDYLLDHSSSKTELTSVVPVDTALPMIELSSLTQMDFAAHHSTGGSTVAITQRISTRQTMTRVAAAKQP